MFEDLQSWITYLKYGDPSGWHIAASFLVLIIAASATNMIGDDITDGFKRWRDRRSKRRKVPLGWDSERAWQSLSINIQKWQHQMLVESLFCDTSLDFEGVTGQGLVCGTEPARLRVMGSIEIRPKFHHKAEDESNPDNVGEFYLADSGYVSIRLQVDRETIAEVFQTFAATSGNNGGINLALHLRHPSGTEPGFWQSGWQQEEIRVSSFRLYAGLLLHKRKGVQ